jgi:large conductance mechanosensitive channel
MKDRLSDFKKFINRGNVVDMAVGVAVASAFTSIVNAFTKGVISPLIALVTGTSHLDEAKWIIREEVLEGEEVIVPEVAILWGSILQAVINFLIIAIVLYTVMKISASIRRHAEKIRNGVVNKLTDLDERVAAEEARLKAEAEEAERLKAEAEAEAARAAKEKEDAERARREREEALLTEIRDLLKNK